MSQRHPQCKVVSPADRQSSLFGPLPGAMAAALMLLAGTPVGLAQVQPASGGQPSFQPATPGENQTPPVEEFPAEELAEEGLPAGGEFADEPQPLRDPMDSQPMDGTGAVTVDEHLIVDLHVHEEDLNNVLQMLSIQSQRSIVASKNVSATVTANLYGVTFYEALDAILHVNGYGYVERGNFIYVYTLEELKEIEKAQRVRVWKVLKLDYLNAIDAAEFVKPLLSEGGQIKTNGKTGVFSIGADGPVGADEFAQDATMLVYDYPENLEEIEKVVGELDTRPAQVLISSTILQTSLNEANAFGVDFSILGDLDFADFLGAPLDAVDRVIGGDGERTGDTGGTVTSTPGRTDGPSTFKLGIVGEDVSVFLRLLDEVSDTTILSRPSLLVLNRQPARVLVGRKVGYLNTTSTDTATTQTVEFLDTGTQLYVRPFVATDGMIRMELKPQVSEAVIRSITDATGAAVTIPDEVTNEITTNVMVRDGQTIVLGGLFRESTQAARRQVPFVGDIPIVGMAFRGHDDQTQRNEIIFMITPTIVSDEVLIDQGLRAQATIEDVRTGAREGLLPFSRERQSGQLLVEAERLAAAGQTQKSLNKVQRALALNPYQPGAIALRERLMNEPTVWPERSMLETILSGEAEPGSAGTPVGDAGAAAESGEVAEFTDAAETGATDDAAFESADAGNEGDPSTDLSATAAADEFGGEVFEPAAPEEFGSPEDQAEQALDEEEPQAFADPGFAGNDPTAPDASFSELSSGGEQAFGEEAGAADEFAEVEFDSGEASDAEVAFEPADEFNAGEPAATNDGLVFGGDAAEEMTPLRRAKFWTRLTSFAWPFSSPADGPTSVQVTEVPEASDQQ